MARALLLSLSCCLGLLGADSASLTSSRHVAAAPLGRNAQENAGRRTLFIHLGPAKTGTTSFQDYLHAHGGLSPTLRFPHTCGMPTPAQGWADFARHILGKSLTHEVGNCDASSEAFLRDVFAAETDLVISAEAFAHCGPEAFRRLRDMFAHAFQIKVLIVRRDPRSLIASRYRQEHKSRAVVSSLAREMVWGYPMERLYDNFAPFTSTCTYVTAECLQTLSGVFGTEHVHVLSYEGMGAAGESLASAVCGLFSSSTCYTSAAVNGNHEQHQAANVSPGHLLYSAAEILNRMNRILGCPGTYMVKRGHDIQVLFRFKQLLVDVGVQTTCMELTNMPPVIECPECFREALAGGKIMAQAHFFDDPSAAFTPVGEVCEFMDTSLTAHGKWELVLGNVKRYYTDKSCRAALSTSEL